MRFPKTYPKPSNATSVFAIAEAGSVCSVKMHLQWNAVLLAILSLRVRRATGTHFFAFKIGR